MQRGRARRGASRDGPPGSVWSRRAPGAPAYTCPDGSIGGNAGRGLRDAAGTCGWELRACPTEVSCGGLTPEPVDCGEGYFCAWEVEHMCGAADHPGTCTLRPSASECAALDGPAVCGCDGVTYDNECFAWAAGQSAIRVGACDAVDCDESHALCDAIPPICPAGQVPSVVGGCWGPCVPTSSCTDTGDCRTWGCGAGQSCEVCLAEDGAVYVCIPDGAAC